ncbi:DNase I-like protein [Plasmodium falciparum NF54]|uniref:CCR4 domain-containing protein 2, putative n=2 Tax=Plasmodium falciparum TaxID=5833 RepID=A0A5K1K929_PLAF7|nr:CCR4 domain-containing protein 2, putative [Plasmodium falciparum 3D7]KAF4326559.1 DNase I-like protein [Plasmodium falciparum NF54]PKC44525.1 DNase I-like protein [Plasmodium falciparum NF54]VWP77953.1 CCR4 domain-containing protein 2, putative [Plasmodium falciparum 3D7]|eukprot:XP_001350347.1 DNase I-like protein, putative [Plasmodium falciparum 3D7]
MLDKPSCVISSYVRKILIRSTLLKNEYKILEYSFIRKCIYIRNENSPKKFLNIDIRNFVNIINNISDKGVHKEIINIPSVRNIKSGEKKEKDTDKIKHIKENNINNNLISNNINDNLYYKQDKFIGSKKLPINYIKKINNNNNKNNNKNNYNNNNIIFKYHSSFHNYNIKKYTIKTFHNLVFNINEECTMENKFLGKYEDNNILYEKDVKNNYDEVNSEYEENTLIKSDLRKEKSKYIFKEFSVFSFNILANSLVDYKYDNNGYNIMQWMNRKKWIHQNIMNKLSDIICLQEIEESYFIELKNELEKLHFKGLFLKKKKDTCKDGICIFYNTKVFELLFFDEVIYDKSCLLKKWHVGLIIALRNIISKRIDHFEEFHENNMNKKNYKNECDRILQNSNTHMNNNKNNNNNNNKNNCNIFNMCDDIVIVSNTHLIFDSYKGDVKLYQICYMTYRLILMMKKCINYIKKRKKGNDNTNSDTSSSSCYNYKNDLSLCPKDDTFLKPCIIVCGDFNITPNSLLYYFIVNRFINLKHINLKYLSGQYLMFNKQYYFYNYLKGIEITKMFDDNIVNDLKYGCSNKLPEQIKKEPLFLIFKDEQILNEEYLLNLINKSNTNKNEKNNNNNNNNNFDCYMDNYNSFEDASYNIKNKDTQNEIYHNYRKRSNDMLSIKGKIKNINNINNINNNNDNNEKKGSYVIQINEKERNVHMNLNEEHNNNILDNEEEDFILYYPLYFKSIYNKSTDNIVEKSCYKYDSIDTLNNLENNLMLCQIPFTVFHGKQKGCVDYIFYSYKNLKQVSYTNLPTFDKLSKYGCLPNQKYASSDHLYLHATLIRTIEE